jgi:acetyl/propionyl-CoA carboxylase alpha subunit
MQSLFRIGHHEHSLWLSAEGPDRFRVHRAGETTAVEATDLFGVRRTIDLDGQTRQLSLAGRGEHLFVHLDGKVFEIEYLPAVGHHAGAEEGSKSDHLVAPMPGALVTCAVAAGDSVEAGDLLITIESMKLETSFKAWRAGRIEAIHVAVGQNFERNRLLLSMVSEETA